MSHIEVKVGGAQIFLDPHDEIEETTHSGVTVRRTITYKPADATRALRVVLSALDVFDEDGIIDSALKTIDGVLGEDTVSV